MPVLCVFCQLPASLADMMPAVDSSGRSFETPRSMKNYTWPNKELGNLYKSAVVRAVKCKNAIMIMMG